MRDLRKIAPSSRNTWRLHDLSEEGDFVDEDVGLAAGADVLVAGSYVFKAERPEDKITELKQLS